MRIEPDPLYNVTPNPQVPPEEAPEEQNNEETQSAEQTPENRGNGINPYGPYMGTYINTQS